MRGLVAVTLLALAAGIVFVYRTLRGAIVALRDDLNAAEAELGQAIEDLAVRIDSLPTDVNDVTQEDVDAIHAAASRVGGLAPSIPVDGPEGPVV